MFNFSAVCLESHKRRFCSKSRWVAIPPQHVGVHRIAQKRETSRRLPEFDPKVFDNCGVGHYATSDEVGFLVLFSYRIWRAQLSMLLTGNEDP